MHLPSWKKWLFNGDTLDIHSVTNDEWAGIVQVDCSNVKGLKMIRFLKHKLIHFPFDICQKV